MTDGHCPWCAEPITPDDRVAPGLSPPTHWECGLRSVAGGLNHQRGMCSCCGGTEDPDPPELTRRDAAKAAAKEWMLRNS
jgi:hypothetical protein